VVGLVAKGSTATRGVAPGAAATAVAGSWLAALLDWDFVCELWAVSSGFEMQPPVSFLLAWCLVESVCFCDLDQDERSCCLAGTV